MELILLLVTLLVILIIVLMKQTQRKVYKLPPGPRGLPFLGNLHQLDKSNPHKNFKQLSDKYGPLMSIKLGSRITLVISSSRLAEEVMTKQDLIFCSRPKFLSQQKFSYGQDMVFSTYNETWRQMRKISAIHLLSIMRVQTFRAMREDEVARMIKEISKAASLSKIIDLNETMMSIANAITCRMTFGTRYEKDDDQERLTFFDAASKAQDLMVSFFFSDYFPLTGWIDRITGATSRLEITFRKLDSIFQKLVDNHLDINRPKSMDFDFIDILPRLKEDESSGIDLTVDHIKAFLLDVLLAGTETIATIIVFAMTALVKSPTAMIKVQEEIRTAIGNKEMVDEDDCQNLPYPNAVLKEAFRLYPPAPMLVPRETMEKCTLDGYEIQPDTMVYINAWAIARDPKVWENPDEFLPERFLNSNIDVKGRDFELIPFGAGRRICPAVSMVLAAVVPILANLLYLFDWSIPPGMKKEDIDTDVLPGITMTKKNHLLLQPNKHDTQC